MAKVSLFMSAIDKISPATKSASQSQELLAKQLDNTRKEANEVNKTLSKVNAYEKVKSSVERAESAHKRYEKQLSALEKAIKSAKKPTQEQINQQAILQQKTTDAAIALRDKSRSLRKLEQDLVNAKVDTKNLSNAQADLTSKSSRYSEELKKQRSEYRALGIAQKQAAKSNEEWAEKKEQYADRAAIATTTAIVASGMAAISDEKAYVDVKKVIDVSETDHKANRQWAHKLASSKAAGGQTAQDIYAIQGNLARAGHTDVATNQAMTLDVMKMATAFDIDDTKQAAEQYNAMVASLGLNRDEAYDMLGAMNFTSNNLKASGSQLLDSMGRAGGVMKTAGFTSKDSLGLLGDMIAKGKGPDEAATSAKNIALAMSKGSSASGTQRDAMLKIGMTPEQLAKDSQKDASGTYIKILERVKSLPKHLQAGVLNDMFGGEAVATVAAQMQNIDTLKKSLTYSNQSKKTNEDSIEKEYQGVLDTRANSIATLMNSFTRLAVIIGDPLLTPLEYLATGLSNAVNSVADFGEKFPEITALIVALGGIATAAYGVKRAFGMIQNLKNIRAGIVNVYGNSAGGSDLSDLGGDGSSKTKGKKSFGGKAFSFATKAAEVAGYYALAEGILESTIGDTGFGKWAKSTTLSDIAPSIFGDSKKEIPDLPINDESIPTADQFDKQAELIRKEESTKTINVNFSGKIEGVTPETEAVMIDAYKANLNNSLYDREGY